MARRISGSEAFVPGGPNERAVDALADAEPVRAGEMIRIRTTGGGGWGDPLDRPYDEVRTDIAWGKVSVEGAWADYAVRVVDGAVDRTASDVERARRRAQRPAIEPFFDRGPGFSALAGGATYAEVDLL